MAKLISTVIVKQALEWLGKMGIKVEPNPELNLYEFEFGDAFVIMHADTPEGVLGYNKYDYRESIVIDYVSVRYADFLKRINYHQKKIM